LCYVQWYSQQGHAIPQLDIFRVETGGGLRWIGTSNTLESAVSSVNILAAPTPGDYLIVSEKTGAKTFISLWNEPQRITKRE
jgi:hypothetical protein